MICSSSERNTLYKKFESKIVHNPSLDRTLVSFQANKYAPFSSWFKYREGFSEKLVTYVIEKCNLEPGILLDPFSGVGSSLFAAATLGWQTIGIELLPVGCFATEARIISQKIDFELFKSIIFELKQINFIDYYDPDYAFNHLKITQGAFSEIDEKKLVGYIYYCNKFVAHQDICTLLLYAAFCILEDISYTRKDGQYLRWDYRSGRSKSKNKFNKGQILNFEVAITQKLKQIELDLNGDVIQLDLFADNIALLSKDKSSNVKNIEPIIYQGTCLENLPSLQENSIDLIITSPPYLNRYDYTRTYALELVFLGCDEEKVKNLRQTMLSCTVENHDKHNYLESLYSAIERYSDFFKINSVFENQAALQEVLEVLENYRKQGKLNNKNIVKMIRNYFYEMCFVIYESARILKPGGIMAMVNDNVRYAGEEIPVDLILSDIAHSFGLTTRHIWTLGRGKGNSSQQMGNHGRSELRKCVYIWENQVS
ncbi:MAG: site-specific DNA-methyltransferase [Rivularia sp. (in: cyanobacteria)]